MLVVVPAHDEEHVVQRCLHSLLRAPAPPGLHVVVVANGCTDGTADRVRALDDPRVALLELPAGGKPAAVRAGLATAPGAAVAAVVDADVELGPGALTGLVAALDVPGARIAAPRLVLDLSACPPRVRRWCAAWSREPYVRGGVIGAGVYAVGAAGLPRLADLPDVLADDGWARARFAPSERLVAPGTFVVRPPRTLAAVVRRRARVLQGNRELATVLPASARPADPAATTRCEGRTASDRLREDGPLAALTWYGVEAGARLLARVRRARGGPAPWGRDSTSRTP